MTHGISSDESDIQSLIESSYSSLPSKGLNVCDLDIPADVVTSFQYNYFTKDETTSRDQTFKGESISSFSTVSEDATQEEILVAKSQYDVPRFNKISWSEAILASRNSLMSEAGVTTEEMGTPDVSVSDNISNVIYEEALTSYQYTGITMQDQQGLTCLEEIAKIAIDTSELPIEFSTPETSSPSSDSNLDVINAYLEAVSDGSSMDGTAKEMLRSAMSNYQSSGDFGFVSRRDEELEYLSQNLASHGSAVDIGMSISNVLADRCADSLISNGGSLYYEEASNSKSVLDQIANSAISLEVAGRISEDDYDISGTPVVVDTIQSDTGMNNSDSSSTLFSHTSDIVGYIVEKLEFDTSGNILSFNPIAVDGKSTTNILDVNVLYGASYKYRVRSVAYIEFDAINVFPGNEAENTTVKSGFLFASRASQWSEVNCIETVPPRPPVDIGFIYDGSNSSLNINWTLPINKQRDIKQINIFKRSSTLEPFGLIKCYYFNDSTTLTATDEIADPDSLILDDKSTLDGALIQVVDGSPGLFHDYDFGIDSSSIYALTSVDARGLTSNYSQQFRVTYNKFNAQIQVELVSRSYAPIPYPNYFISQDTFIDTMKISNFEKMTVYFDPEYLTVNEAIYDDDGNISEDADVNLISTHQDNPSYKISMINLDNQKSKNIDIYVRDIRDATLQSDEGEEYSVKTRIASLFSDI